MSRAISHWTENTPIRLVARTDQPNFVRFARQQGGCTSPVGMIGGEQRVNLDDGCTTPLVIHEIGHVVGLFHEHSRHDRDLYVKVLPQEADKREVANLQQVLVGSEDDGYYDFASIMHYTGLAFARGGQPPLQSIPAGIPVGRTEVLSAGDIDAVKRLYRASREGTTITTFPPGLEVEVDGERFTAPCTFQWESGTRHTISAVPVQTSGNTRHLFAAWNDGRGLNHTIVASDEQRVYSANFIRQYRVTLGSAGPGTIQPETPSDDGWFTEDSEIQLRAIPQGGSKFAGWSGFGQFALHGISPNPLRFRATRPDIRYVANFTNGPLTTITSEPAGMRILLDGEAVTTPVGVPWPAGSSHTIEVPDEIQYTAARTTRHMFQQWTNEAGTARRQTITVAGDSTYVARFRTEQQLLLLQPTLGNRIVANPGAEDGWYEQGTRVTLQAEAAPGFRHLGWTYDASGTTNPTTIVMDEQKLVSAGFAVPRQIAAIVNGANFLYQSGVAPGSIIAIGGIEIGPENPIGMRVSPSGTVDTNLDGYRVLFDDVPAPLLYATRDQIGATVPYGIAGRSETIVRLVGPQGSSNPVRVPVLPANPAIFTANAGGRGQAAALNQDGSVNSPQNPATKGGVVVLYATGEGAANPASATGQITSGSTLPTPVLPVAARVAGQTARVLYAGAAPGLIAGAMQVNVQIPEDTPSGAVLIAIKVGETWSVNSVTISVN